MADALTQDLIPEKAGVDQIVQPTGKTPDSGVSAYQYNPVTGTNSQGPDGLLDSPVPYGRDPAARPSNDWQDISTTDSLKNAAGGIDSAGLLDNAVTDINKLMDQDNDLMKAAKTRGMQFANERGMANSSMAGTMGQQAALDVVMPLVDKRMGVDSQALLANQQGNINAQLQDLNVENQAYLTSVDQAFNSFMESNKNAMSFYQTSQEQIGAIMNNPDLTLEQRRDAIYEIQQALTAGLNFNSSLYSADFGGGASPVAGNPPVSGGAASPSQYPGGTSGGNYPGSPGGAQAQTNPQTMFKSAYVSTSPTGSVLVDMGQLDDLGRKELYMLKLVKDGTIKWDDAKKKYVYAKASPLGRVGQEVKQININADSVDSNGNMITRTPEQLAALNPMNAFTQGMRNFSPEELRTIQELRGRNVYPSVTVNGKKY